MKKLIYLISIIVCSFAMFSCESIEIEPIVPEVQEDVFVTVSFSVGAEGVVLVGEEPLTKASSPSDLYGFSIYEYEDFDHDCWTYHEYCYGLLDNISDLSIKFRKGYHYLLTMIYLPDGKSIVEKKGIEYGVPFCRYPSITVSEEIPLNSVIYDTENTLYCLGGSFDTYDYGRCYHAPFDFYVYKDWNFEPKNDEKISIELKHANAGITFQYNKVEGFDYDKVVVKFVNEQWEYTTDITSDDNKLVIPLITISESGTPFVNHLCDYDCVEVIIGTSEEPSLFYRGKLGLTPNVMKTYDVYLRPVGSTTNPFDITSESDSMSNETCGSLN